MLYWYVKVMEGIAAIQIILLVRITKRLYPAFLQCRKLKDMKSSSHLIWVYYVKENNILPIN